ncbi:MAG: hypothetical protein WB780_23275 [Candidatus Acidiferrales bacterium]
MAFLLLFLLALVFPGLACAGNAPAAEPEACNLTPDELDVYSATIQELLLKDHGDPARVILRDRTSAGYPPGMATMKSTAENQKEVLEASTLETRDDFDRKNKAPCKLEPKIQPVERIRLLTQMDEQVSFPRGSGSWKIFYANYPGATGFTLVSRIGFNSARDQALVYLGNSCELLCGHGYLVLLKKHNGKWKFLKQAGIWVAG